MTSFRGKRVLLTGDSHMEWSPFGRALEAKLRDLGATVVNVSVGGSSARSWASGRACRPGTEVCHTLADLTATRPDVAIISLGTNDAANADAEGADPRAAAQQTAERLRQVVSAIGAREVWIVGPPRMGRTTGHYTDATMAPVVDALRRMFGNRFVDSRAVPRIDGDGIHVGARGGEAWASYAVAKMTSGGSSAILGMALLFGGVWYLMRRKG